MRAHFVPIAYLKGFSKGTGDPRRSSAVAIARDKVFQASLDNLCVCSDYYTAFPEEDAALFAQDEPFFATLVQGISAGVASALHSIPQRIWSLKLRNRSILDFSYYRQLVMAAGANVDLSSHTARVIFTPPPDQLITSDDPVLIFGIGNPSEQCFILPLTPNLLVVSASTTFFSLHSSTATSSDVQLLDRLQYQQARRHIICYDMPPTPKLYQEDIPVSPRRARSEIRFTPSRNGGYLILNFFSYNPRGPGMSLSFLSPK